MVEKNLFPYDLAVVAIFKDEAPYLREWLDYHLLAGAEHFYLYDNGSTDNFAAVLKPYVDANLVTLINFPGKLLQYPAYEDALDRFRFQSRCMAFIDCDEFIFPKSDRTITEVVDEVFSRNPNAAALAINWQCFGSNNLETADYSRGVLERFTRRAESNWFKPMPEDVDPAGNIHVKTIANPRLIDYIENPHYACYFDGVFAVNGDGGRVDEWCNMPVLADKIVVNHYFTKSREECLSKIARGRADVDADYPLERFEIHDRNEIFDDGILHYRARRAENFSLEDDAERFARVKKFLVETLTQRSPFDAPPEFFVGKLETFLTCRALAEMLDVKIGSRSAEEFALAWIYQTLTQAETLTNAEVRQFIRALPEILLRPFPLCRKLNYLAQNVVIPSFCDELKRSAQWQTRSELLNLQKFLRLIN